MYRIDYTDIANKGLAKLLKSDPKAFKKALAFIDELKEHPTTGTGHPEPLKGSARKPLESSHFSKAPFGLPNL